MRERTQYFGARAYPSDVEKLRQLRTQLQQQHPNIEVSVADVLRLAVGSASAVVAAGGGLPVALDLPRQAPRNPAA